MALTIVRSQGPSDGPERQSPLERLAGEWEIEPLPEESELYLASLTSLLVEWNSAEDAAAFDDL